MVVDWRASSNKALLSPLAVDASTGAVSELPEQTARGDISPFREGAMPGPGYLTTIDKGLAHPFALHTYGGSAWSYYPDLASPGEGPALRSRAADSWQEPMVGERLARRGQDLVVTGVAKSTGYVRRGPDKQEARTLTVIDPRLGALDVIVAVDATDRRASASLFGTSTNPVAWRPGPYLAGGAAVLLAIGLLVRNVRKAGRPDRG